jgi:Holliday junction resolvasome RuvABC endonuclease subunit
MLRFPQKGSTSVCFCGIDPGTNYLGFSVFTFEVVSLSILSIDAVTFESEKLVKGYSNIFESHSERTAKIIAQKDNLVSQFRFNKPAFVCCESPFYNRLRPSAYGPLVEMIFAIKTACIEYDKTMPFYLYDPSSIKKTIGANAIGDKKNVYNALCKHEEILAKLKHPIDKYDEHSIDSIAIAYSHFCYLKSSFFLL